MRSCLVQVLIAILISSRLKSTWSNKYFTTSLYPHLAATWRHFSLYFPFLSIYYCSIMIISTSHYNSLTLDWIFGLACCSTRNFTTFRFPNFEARYKEFWPSPPRLLIIWFSSLLGRIFLVVRIYQWENRFKIWYSLGSSRSIFSISFKCASDPIVAHSHRISVLLIASSEYCTKLSF